MNTNLFERVLVPTEMNAFGHLPLRYALLFNERLGSKLTLLYADEISWLAKEHPVGYTFENEKDAEAKLQLQLREFANRYTPANAGVSTLFVDDSPAHAIVTTARETHADLIVMGTHGRHGWSRVLMGSVAERVLRESDVPVLTVRPDLAPLGDKVAIRSVLCPVNFTEVARVALEEATAVAEAFEANLIVLHVCEEDRLPDDSVQEERFATWIDPLIREHTRYERLFVHGDAAVRVLETADHLQSGVLVIGAQHKRFSDATTIGTTTERLTRFARLPVLTVMRKTASSSLQAAA